MKRFYLALLTSHFLEKNILLWICTFIITNCIHLEYGGYSFYSNLKMVFKDQRISFISSCLLVYRGRHLLWLHFRKELTNLKSQLSKIELSLLFKTILASDTLISYFCFVLNKVWTQFSLKQGKQIHCKKFYIKNLERGELSTSI